MLEFYQYRILKALEEEGGEMTRWKFTRKAVKNLKPTERQLLVEYMEKSGFIIEITVRKEVGAGAPAVHYRITEKGKDEFQRVAATLKDGRFSSGSGSQPPYAA